MSVSKDHQRIRNLEHEITDELEGNAGKLKDIKIFSNVTFHHNGSFYIQYKIIDPDNYDGIECFKDGISNKLKELARGEIKEIKMEKCYIRGSFTGIYREYIIAYPNVRLDISSVLQTLKKHINNCIEENKALLRVYKMKKEKDGNKG